MGELKEKASRYADAFDGNSPLADVENRSQKAAKIFAVLDEEGALAKANVRILDIGCAFGHILKKLTPADGFGVGVDMDTKLGSPSENVSFLRADAENLPFQDGTFDVVICNHVYEHTDDASALLSEIHRIMHDGGACYFAGPNKFELIEPHYGLPFLSWLPRPLADRYMRITGKGDSYPEKPFSPPRVRRLLKNFRVVSYTKNILHDPVRYAATDILPVASVKRRIALLVYKFAPFFFPGFVYVLRKNGTDAPPADQRNSE